MSKLVKYYFFVLISFHAFINAQQFPQYTQFIFNKIGYSPAASGTSVNAPYELILGARTQWIGLSNNPKSEFVSFNYNFVPQHSYHNWHNVGVYIDQDQNGNFVHNDVWLSYTFHLLASRKLLLSAGLFAGIKQYKLTTNNLDKNDPAVQKSSGSVIAYPDVIPGIRLSSKKFFADLCVSQVTVFGQKGIGGQIGSPSKIIPHYNLSVGKKGNFNDFNVVMIAMNIRGSITGKPSAEVNIMNYYDRKIAFGFSVRSKNFVCGILQMRLLRNLNVGFAYDFSVNKMLPASPNTVELMLSVSPVFGGELSDKASRRIVDNCTF